MLSQLSKFMQISHFCYNIDDATMDNDPKAALNIVINIEVYAVKWWEDLKNIDFYFMWQWSIYSWF